MSSWPRSAPPPARATRFVRVDAYLVEAAEVDDDPAVGRGVPDRAVTAAADGDLEVLFTTESNRRGDIVDAGRPNEHGRSAIKRRVPDPAGIVVVGGRWSDDLAGEGAPKRVELGGRERGV